MLAARRLGGQQATEVEIAGSRLDGSSPLWIRRATARFLTTTLLPKVSRFATVRLAARHQPNHHSSCNGALQWPHHNRNGPPQARQAQAPSPPLTRLFRLYRRVSVEATLPRCSWRRYGRFWSLLGAAPHASLLSASRKASASPLSRVLHRGVA